MIEDGFFLAAAPISSSSAAIPHQTYWRFATSFEFGSRVEVERMVSGR